MRSDFEEKIEKEREERRGQEFSSEEQDAWDKALRITRKANRELDRSRIPAFEFLLRHLSSASKNMMDQEPTYRVLLEKNDDPLA